MNLLLSAFGDWLGKNWIIIVLIVFAIALLVPTYLRQKKEMNARNELNSTIKKGTKIITTAGVYGVVDYIEDTTDGKVVTIITGNSKNPTTMTIHINAIGGIDNKKTVVVDEEGKAIENNAQEIETKEEPVVEVAEESVVETSEKPAKKTTKKSTKSKK